MGILKYSLAMNSFLNNDGWFMKPKYWLEEVEDHEEEMREMIKELISELDPSTLSGNYQQAIDRANAFLTKLKQ